MSWWTSEKIIQLFLRSKRRVVGSFSSLRRTRSQELMDATLASSCSPVSPVKTSWGAARFDLTAETTVCTWCDGRDIFQAKVRQRQLYILIIPSSSCNNNDLVSLNSAWYVPFLSETLFLSHNFFQHSSKPFKFLQNSSKRIGPKYKLFIMNELLTAMYSIYIAQCKRIQA